MTGDQRDEFGLTSHCGSEVFSAVVSRRMALRAAGLLALSSALPTASAASRRAPLDFDDLPLRVIATHAVAQGYIADVLIRWGDPILPNGANFAPEHNSGANQLTQFGINNDFVGYFPLPDHSNASFHGLLAVNHEYNSYKTFFPGRKAEDLSADDIEADMAAVGLSIIEVKKIGEKWSVVPNSRYARRITPNTPMRLSGPVAGHARVQTSADPLGVNVLGTYGNCSGGRTPWGTVLTAEENFHQAFRGAAPEDHPERKALEAYGLDGKGKSVWGQFDPRFDVHQEPLEANRFGYIVEIDPYDPSAVPIKRTHLGRFRHEAASVVINRDGRVVVYLGEDRAFGYIYRFISTKTYSAAMSKAQCGALLDEGTLYVAKFTPEALEWLPLVPGRGALSSYHSLADVMIEATLAAQAVGATPMDRPEDMEVNPVNGRIYVNLTMNEDRVASKVDAANPRGPNNDGHILELMPPRGDHCATEFEWSTLMICGTAATGARYGRRTRTALSAPDNMAFDPKGRIWIATDNDRWEDKALTIPNGLFASEVDGPDRARVKFFFNVPSGAEVCGPEFTPDGHTLFVAVQHPDWSKTPDQGNWPDWTPGLPPRSSIVVITRRGGGPIGG